MALLKILAEIKIVPKRGGFGTDYKITVTTATTNNNHCATIKVRKLGACASR